MVYELPDRRRVDVDVKSIEFEDKVNALESENKPIVVHGGNFRGYR